MKYPCKLCLVKACCNYVCNEYYDFINYWAANMCKLTADEIHEFRMDTSAEVKHEVSRLLGRGEQYDYKVRDKLFVAIRSKNNFWNYQKRGGRSA